MPIDEGKGLRNLVLQLALGRTKRVHDRCSHCIVARIHSRSKQDLERGIDVEWFPVKAAPIFLSTRGASVRVLGLVSGSGLVA